MIGVSERWLKQKKFADEYLKTGNIYQSAIAAGYSHNYAKGNGKYLLDNERVKAYIEERLKEIDSKMIAEQKEVLEYLTSVLRGEEKDEVLTNVGDVVEVKVNNKDRIKAAELFGKFYGTWTEKVDLSVNKPVVIEGYMELED